VPEHQVGIHSVVALILQIIGVKLCHQSYAPAFLPQIPLDGRADWLTPGIVLDASDGKLVHLDGVNLSPNPIAAACTKLWCTASATGLGSGIVSVR
jgi:hypothetical protein